MWRNTERTNVIDMLLERIVSDVRYSVVPKGEYSRGFKDGLRAVLDDIE